MAKSVMIVEDNELNMTLFHDLLEAHGYHTIGTRDGLNALDLARKHRPDLIVMATRNASAKAVATPICRNQSRSRSLSIPSAAFSARLRKYLKNDP